MSAAVAGRPESGEYAPYYDTYIGKVAGSDPVAALAAQTPQVDALFARIDGTRARQRYGPGKWSVQEIIGHVTDAERVFGFRALWFARADPAALPGFDENVWVPAAGFDALPIAQVVEAWRAQRGATLALLRSFGADAWTRRGTASGKVMSVRALAFVIAGHEVHHVGVLRERYGVA
ncbi:MAG: hypothetical protein A2085_06830 [Gemmatimonadetes bacterium GWC2_71_10]|nr:MAG: hypothetical protein A2085_06830 [Gemmatimonadetes bacterium GWC2_71_10]